MSEASLLQRIRHAYVPKIPAIMEGGLSGIELLPGEKTGAVADADKVAKLFPRTFGQPMIGMKKGMGSLKRSKLRVGVVLSGGPAPGGHNAILGLRAGLRNLNTESEVIGFMKGPSGIIDNKTRIIDDECEAKYLNTGGFNLIQSGRTKIETDEQFAACKKTVTDQRLDALVVIGGDDSNTNAAMLAEYFQAQGMYAQVIGIPKTIDGDLKNAHIETSFGFDTACRTYAELVGNIARDAVSSAKYWHFIKLMGRSASHITLEVALATHVNVALIGEEIRAKNITLAGVVDGIAQVVAARAAKGRNYGMVLVPEGLIEFIPEIGRLLSKLNDILAAGAKDLAGLEQPQLGEAVCARLNAEERALFQSLPPAIQRELLAERDPHGNVQVSLIETEQLLATMVAKRLKEMAKAGTYKGKFSHQHHFFGYEGRCGLPSNFDTNYTWGLGLVAAVLIAGGKTGYMASLSGLERTPAEWRPGGVPLTCMMNIEHRHGKDKPVIRKALVELGGKAFAHFAREREAWALENAYFSPGPIQFFGPPEICDSIPEILRLEK